MMQIEEKDPDQALEPCAPADPDAAKEPEQAAGAEADDEGAEAAEAEDAQEVDVEAPAEDATSLKDQLLRALADTENVRRRAKKDVDDARRYAIANFARDLLGVADNMERALQSIPAEARAENEALKGLAEGVEMTARELDTVFERHGIEKIAPKGEKFDYNRHQALFESADTDQPDGTVIEVAQVGYLLGDRLLRAAMVGVAKGGKAKEPEDAAGETAEPVGGRVDTSA